MTSKKSNSNEKTLKLYSPEWCADKVERHPWMYQFITQYKLNLLYDGGEQYLKIMPDGVTIADAHPKREQKLVKNVSKKMRIMWVSKLFSNLTPPEVTVFEKEGSTKNADLALQANAVAEKLIADQDLRKKIRRVGNDTYLSCMAYVDVDFDKSKGNKIFHMNEMVNPGNENESKDIYEGETYVENVPPDCVFPDELATTMSNTRYLQIVRKVSRTSCEKWFKLKPGSLEPDQETRMESEHARLSGRFTGAHSTSGDTEDEFVILYELRVKGSAGGKGLRRFCTKSKVLWSIDEWPSWRPLLLHFHPGQVDFSTYFSEPPATLARDPQKQINKTLSVMSENIDFFGFMKYLVKENTVDKKYFTNAPGVMMYRQNIKPEIMQPRPMPAYIQNMIPQMEDSMLAVHGITQPGAGALGARMTGASSLTIEQILQSEESYFGEAMEHVASFVAELFKLALRTIGEKYGKKRVAEMSGFGSQMSITYEPKIFTSNMDVNIQIGSVGKTVDQKNEENYMLLKDGFITTEDYLLAKLRYNGNLRPSTDKYIADRQKAEFNLNLILTEDGKDGGWKWLEPDSVKMLNMLSGMLTRWDNASIHKDVFVSFTKRPEFIELPAQKSNFIFKYIEQAEQFEMMSAPPPGQPDQGAQQSTEPTNIYEDQANLLAQQQSPGPPIGAPQTQTVAPTGEESLQGEF
jgi:hypothetical protein